MSKQFFQEGGIFWPTSHPWLRPCFCGAQNAQFHQTTWAVKSQSRELIWKLILYIDRIALLKLGTLHCLCVYMGCLTACA